MHSLCLRKQYQQQDQKTQAAVHTGGNWMVVAAAKAGYIRELLLDIIGKGEYIRSYLAYKNEISVKIKSFVYLKKILL